MDINSGCSERMLPWAQIIHRIGFSFSRSSSWQSFCENIVPQKKKTFNICLLKIYIKGVVLSNPSIYFWHSFLNKFHSMVINYDDDDDVDNARELWSMIDDQWFDHSENWDLRCSATQLLSITLQSNHQKNPIIFILTILIIIILIGISDAVRLNA